MIGQPGMDTVTHSIVVTEEHWSSLLRHFEYHDERMGFAYCGISSVDGQREFLVREIDLPGDDEYRSQGACGISLKAEHVVERVMKARGYGAFLDLHSHPFTEHPSPSGTDAAGARVQLRVLRDLAPGVFLVRMVFGRNGTVWADVAERDVGDWTPVDRIVVLGASRRRVVRPVNADKHLGYESRLQDLRAAAVLGSESVASIRCLRVAVIGTGGVGSAVIAQLRGYVDDLAVVDPDVIESHNASRLYHYADGDDGEAKVVVHKREIQRAFPACRVHALRAAFPDEGSLELFKRADVVFCCPDHNAVRYAAATAAARFMKPLIEVGCGGKTADGRIVGLGYHVRLQIPGQPCLACNGLDLTQLEDPSSSAMKRRIGYVTDGDLVAGELMPLTTRAAADAVDLFFRYMTGYAPTVRHLYFDALRFQALDLSDAHDSRRDCTLCGSTQLRIAGAGDRLGSDQQLLPAPDAALMGHVGEADRREGADRS